MGRVKGTPRQTGPHHEGKRLMAWTVYMLECADTSLYTGITVDLARRLEEHSKGKGAKYTRHRGPFTVVFTELQETRGQALKREAAIKAMTREGKLGLLGTR
ncbi:MAG: GIY-YIG nuclease family protein [Nitrospirales bacterium]